MIVKLDSMKAARYARLMYEHDPVRGAPGDPTWTLRDPQLRRRDIEAMQAFLDHMARVGGE